MRVTYDLSSFLVTMRDKWVVSMRVLSGEGRDVVFTKVYEGFRFASTMDRMLLISSLLKSWYQKVQGIVLSLLSKVGLCSIRMD